MVSYQYNTSTIEDLRKKHSGTLEDYSEDFKTTQRSVEVPSSHGMFQVFLRTFGLWNLGTLKDYSPRPSRLLEDILLDYKVLGGLLYGHP
jgi:ABC-type Zn uptake system ZnuABC Zn-binding protein ZnuA